MKRNIYLLVLFFLCSFIQNLTADELDEARSRITASYKEAANLLKQRNYIASFQAYDEGIELGKEIQDWTQTMFGLLYKSYAANDYDSLSL